MESKIPMKLYFERNEHYTAAVQDSYTVSIIHINQSERQKIFLMAYSSECQRIKWYLQRCIQVEDVHAVFGLTNISYGFVQKTVYLMYVNTDKETKTDCNNNKCM